MTLLEGSASAPGWLDGLRGSGGIEIPVVGALLSRLDFLFYYALVLWSLAAARREFPGTWPVVVAHKTALTVVTALAAVAFLGFTLDLSTTFFLGQGEQDYVTAGPLALLLAGTAAVWPIACSKVASVSLPGTGLPPLKSVRERCAAAAYAAIPVLYLVILRSVFHLYPLTSARIMLGTATVTALVPCAIHQLLGRHQGAIVWLASAGTLAVAVAVTITWPMLWYGSFGTLDGLYHVNAAGKLTYVAATVFVVAGLWILSAKAGPALARPARARWQWPRTAAVIIGIGAAVLPAAVMASHARRSCHRPDTSGPVRPVRRLAAVARLGAARSGDHGFGPAADHAGPAAAARRIAIPVGLLLLYWNGTWLYVPVIVLIGLLALRRIALPSNLARVPCATTRQHGRCGRP